MKQQLGWILLGTMLLGCGKETGQTAPPSSPTLLAGTWKLVRGTVIEKGDTTVTDYTKDKSFIKIINDTHFAFLLHDLTQGKDSAAVYASGGGTYSLADGQYTEHLEYCSDRAWEGHDFAFAVTIRNDSLIQRGIEKVESAGVDRVNIEEYTKVKQ
jgi:hypothetical protein